MMKMKNPFKMLGMMHEMAMAEKAEQKEIELAIKTAESIIIENTQLLEDMKDRECDTLADYVRKFPSQAWIHGIVSEKFYDKHRKKKFVSRGEDTTTAKKPTSKESSNSANKYYAKVYEEAQDVIEILEGVAVENRNAALYLRTLAALLEEMEEEFGVDPIVEEEEDNED